MYEITLLNTDGDIESVHSQILDVTTKDQHYLFCRQEPIMGSRRSLTLDMNDYDSIIIKRQSEV